MTIELSFVFVTLIICVTVLVWKGVANIACEQHFKAGAEWAVSQLPFAGGKTFDFKQ
ncbi:MAG: hypothetical protein IJ743_03250 [Bacilli bacterium]|nr:hypothetical protein [Bacilli bacterium]